VVADRKGGADPLGQLVESPDGFGHARIVTL
jgi:hypothetical protein